MSDLMLGVFLALVCYYFFTCLNVAFIAADDDLFEFGSSSGDRESMLEEPTVSEVPDGELTDRLQNWSLSLHLK